MVTLVTVAKLATLKDKSERVCDATHCSLPTKESIFDLESAAWVSKRELSSTRSDIN